MKKTLFLSCFFLSLYLVFSCKQTQTASKQKTGDYPKEIKDFHLEKKFDNTKWALYCIQCDELCNFDKKTNISDTVTFGMLPLKFQNLEQLHDTTELYFNFFYKDSLKCDYRILRNLTINLGAAYGPYNDSVVYFLRLSSMNRHWENAPHSRYQKLLQPEVLKYITENKSKLNSWFREEAIRRGVIKTD